MQTTSPISPTVPRLLCAALLAVLATGCAVTRPLKGGKALTKSVTTSAALALGGLALIVLPTLLVGNELLILGGVALAVGAWFLAHRHGQLRGTVAALTQPSPLPPPTPPPDPSQIA